MTDRSSFAVSRDYSCLADKKHTKQPNQPIKDEGKPNREKNSKERGGDCRKL